MGSSNAFLTTWFVSPKDVQGSRGSEGVAGLDEGATRAQVAFYLGLPMRFSVPDPGLQIATCLSVCGKSEFYPGQLAKDVSGSWGRGCTCGALLFQSVVLMSTCRVISSLHA